MLSASSSLHDPIRTNAKLRCRDALARAKTQSVMIVLPDHDTSLHHTSLVGVGYATRSSIFSTENDAAGADARKPEWVMNPTTITLTM
jgi:hypothetical protein